ncbi:MAG: hypothetical protein PF517_00855 [Salinivirgaceae bacterium]|jgi:hypothetical protein|nr:hypothetical protein [Salinivirgaceae bacterium]
MNHSVKIKTRPSKKYSNDKSMLFIRINISRQTKYYSLGTNYACFENEWDTNKEHFKKNFKGYQNADSHLESVKMKANKALIELELKGEDYIIHDFDVLFK